MTRFACFIFILAVSFISCVDKQQMNRLPRHETSSDAAIARASMANPYSGIDVSPMDMSYFPVNYPQEKMTHKISTPPVMRVIYSRPHKLGRTIFDSLLKYGVPWRLGANEASEIEFFKNVTIQNKKINVGRDIIYCIPYKDKWTIILNNDLYTWGLQIDSTKDLVRFDVPVKKSPVNFDYFTMVFQSAANGADLVMAWDDAEVRLPINF